MAKQEENTNLDEYQLKDQQSSTKLPTLSEIKVKLPAYCFRPSLCQSVTYIIKDIFFVIFAFILMYQVEHTFKYGMLLWPLYWYFQGTIYMGFFALGHDCSHGSFSVYPLLNDIVGNFVHTWILLPYYPWKITHNNHHKNTGNIDKDEAFYPLRIEPYKRPWYEDILVYAPGLAWFRYLISGYGFKQINHFNPFEPIFNKHIIGVSLSLTVYLGMCYFMYLFAIYVGIISLICYHIIPVFIFGCYFVIVTMLHHTEIDVPWYIDSEWNYVKGQLSTIDRHYGHVHSLIHSIGTHQIHHLFAKIPHYHLETTTMHFRKAFPDLVRIKHDAILPSFLYMVKIFLRQRTIGPNIRIFTYTNDQDKNSKK